MLAVVATSGLALAGPRASSRRVLVQAAPHIQKLHARSPRYSAIIHYPELSWTGHRRQMDGANQTIQGLVHRTVDAFAERVTAALRHNVGAPKTLPESSLTLVYRTNLLNAQVASFVFIEESYITGQADVGQTPEGLTINLHSGKAYELAALFRPHGAYLSALARLGSASLRGWKASSHCYIGGGLSPRSVTEAAWSLVPDGLELTLPAGIYTAAYCGVPSITIGRQALRPYLRPHARHLWDRP